MQRETDIDSLEVRNYSSLKWKTLLAIILCIATLTSIIAKISSQDFWLHFKPSSLFYLFGLTITAIGIIYYSKSLYYDRWVQLKIDKDGIWTPKNKTWLWKDIWYFSTSSERNGKYRINFLQIKLKDGISDKNNSLILPLDNYDKSKEEIRNMLAKYAALNNIQDLGDEIKN